jgi:hypothetical protein
LLRCSNSYKDHWFSPDSSSSSAAAAVRQHLRAQSVGSPHLSETRGPTQRSGNRDVALCLRLNRSVGTDDRRRWPAPASSLSSPPARGYSPQLQPCSPGRSTAVCQIILPCPCRTRLGVVSWIQGPGAGRRAPSRAVHSALSGTFTPEGAYARLKSLPAILSPRSQAASGAVCLGFSTSGGVPHCSAPGNVS